MRDNIQGMLQFRLFQIPMVGADTDGFSGTVTTDEEKRTRSSEEDGCS